MRIFLWIVRAVVIVVVVVFGVGYWAMDSTYGSHGKVTLDNLQSVARALAEAENEFYGREHTFTGDIRKLGDYVHSDDSLRVISADARHWSASVGYVGRTGPCVFGGSWSSTGRGPANGSDAIMRAAKCADGKTDRLWHARLEAAH